MYFLRYNHNANSIIKVNVPTNLPTRKMDYSIQFPVNSKAETKYEGKLQIWNLM